MAGKHREHLSAISHPCLSFDVEVLAAEIAFDLRLHYNFTLVVATVLANSVCKLGFAACGAICEASSFQRVMRTAHVALGCRDSKLWNCHGPTPKQTDAQKTKLPLSVTKSERQALSVELLDAGQDNFRAAICLPDRAANVDTAAAAF